MTHGTAVAKRDAEGKAPAVIAAIRAPGLVVFEKHREDLLLGWDYDELDAAGKLVPRRWPARPVSEYTKLIPVGACHALIGELDAALAPAVYGQAKALARLVMGRYTKRELNDPEIYVFELTRVFGEAPADLGREACDRLRIRVFMPNAAEVKIVLDGLVSERANARAQAKRHLAEHARRRAAAAKPKPDVVTPKQAAAILEDSGVRKDLDDAEARAKAGQPVPGYAIRMRERTAAAALETFNRQREAAEAAGE